MYNIYKVTLTLLKKCEDKNERMKKIYRKGYCK